MDKFPSVTEFDSYINNGFSADKASLRCLYVACKKASHFNVKGPLFYIMYHLYIEEALAYCN